MQQQHRGNGAGSSGGRGERKGGWGGKVVLPQLLLSCGIKCFKQEIRFLLLGVGERNQSNPAVQFSHLWLRFSLDPLKWVTGWSKTYYYCAYSVTFNSLEKGMLGAVQGNWGREKRGVVNNFSSSSRDLWWLLVGAEST